MFVLLHLSLSFFSFIIGKPDFTVDKRDVIVNQTVTFTCTFQSGTNGFDLIFPSNLKCPQSFCTLNACKNSYLSLKCPSNRTYQITIRAKETWNSIDIKCGDTFGGEKSDPVSLNVMGNDSK